MSEGIRSGVNWMRLNPSDIVFASELTSKRLRQAGNAHQQAVAPRENGDHHLIDDVLHAHDRLAQLFYDRVSGFAEFLHGLNVVCFFCHMVS